MATPKPHGKPLTTAIAHAYPDRVEVRGFDLAAELIGSTSASEYFYVLLTGARPSPVQVQILDACIVALAEHGLVPSVQAARMTYASGPESLHGAVAAGLTRLWVGDLGQLVGDRRAAHRGGRRARLLRRPFESVAGTQYDACAQAVGPCPGSGTRCTARPTPARRPYWTWLPGWA